MIADNEVELATDLLGITRVTYEYNKDFAELRKSVGNACNLIYDKIPSLTLEKIKNGYRLSNYADYSHFLFGNDLCYFFISSVFVLFIMLRMADFEINS